MQDYLIIAGKKVPVDHHVNITDSLKQVKFSLTELTDTWDDLKNAVNLVTKPKNNKIMNKTININLAGLFFHIDEDAYQRLQRYLAAVRRSFAGTKGADEIMCDIESRIAELFLEKTSK